MRKQIISPISGLESKTFSVHRITKIPQASYISLIRSPALSVNQLAETNRHPANESREQILQYPFEAPMPRHLKHFKKLLPQTLSPHTMNKILRELDAGQLDRRSLDDSNGSPSEFSQEESLLSNSPVTRNNLYYTYPHPSLFDCLSQESSSSIILRFNYKSFYIFSMKFSQYISNFL